MRNAKTGLFSALCFAIILVSHSAFAKGTQGNPKVLSHKELKQIQLILKPDTRKLVIDAKHSYAISLQNDPKHTYFWINAVGGVDHGLITLLIKDGKVISETKDVNEWEFRAVRSVKFVDLNHDGFNDVIILSDYHPEDVVSKNATFKYPLVLLNTGKPIAKFKAYPFIMPCKKPDTFSKVEACLKTAGIK